MEDITNLIKAHKEINKELVEISDVGLDDNCFYRTLSLYFTSEESFIHFLENKYI